MQSLPIDPLLPSVVATLQQHSSLVLQAPPGAGKTTRIPRALLDAEFAEEGLLLVVEPRRVAARSAAVRVALEAGEKPGQRIGYQVRFEKKFSSSTKVLFLTEGMLLQRLQADPFLEDVAVVIFDEFHERRMASDLSLAMLKQLQAELRPELRLLVMSATLDTALIQQWLNDCPVLTSEGNMYPVEIRYQPFSSDVRLSRACASAIRSVLPESKGHLLAFLPGVREIRETKEALSNLEEQGFLVLPLHGSLPLEEQDRVLRPSPKKKIILATNIAETSLTIDGVTTVVDSGFERVNRFDSLLGLNRLLTERISKASAEQRKGRAGRQQPGLCVRLWDQHQHRHLSEQIEAEVCRADVTEAVLQLASWGERDPAGFDWLETPPETSLFRAMDCLESLGALDSRGLSSLGQEMSNFPLQPRLARLCIEGHKRGIPTLAARCAALLSEKDPFRRADYGQERVFLFSDVLSRLDALEMFDNKSWTRFDVGELSKRQGQHLLKTARQIQRVMTSLSSQPGTRAKDTDRALTMALLAAFPDRVARRRGELSERGRMVGGRGVRLAPGSGVMEPELFLCLHMDGGQSGQRAEARVFLASGLKKQWLPEKFLKSEIQLRFDEKSEKIVAVAQKLYRDLVLEEKSAPLPSSWEVAEALAEAASLHWERALDWEHKPLHEWLQRVAFLRHWRPELELPDFDKDTLLPLLPGLCHGKRSFAELRKESMLQACQSLLSWEQLQTIEELAPERVKVPSGSRIRLQYRGEEPPILSVRIQEVFGWADTPRLAGGRAPVLLHLLAPNHRPQQVTQDLRNFWESTYFEVRKELRQRYPKHAWPEDPWNAQPERRPRRKK